MLPLPDLTRPEIPSCVVSEEEILLGALVTHPQQMREVADWLNLESFADPGHAHIYRALGALHHRGEPVDQLTVLWECQRRGALADGTLEADRVRQVCGSAAGRLGRLLRGTGSRRLPAAHDCGLSPANP